MASQVHVNPRFRAYGKARLDIARRAKTREEWEALWKPARFEFPFSWGKYWKQCIEYRVEDYAAEAGFFIDVLGFPVNAFDPEYAQFTSPDGDFFIAIVPASDYLLATPPEALTLQFMVARLPETVRELENRGVIFEQEPRPLQPGSHMLLASFRTPHGITIELWGEQVSTMEIQPPAKKPSVASPREAAIAPKEPKLGGSSNQRGRVSTGSPALKTDEAPLIADQGAKEIKPGPAQFRTLPASTQPNSSRQPAGKIHSRPTSFIPPARAKVLPEPPIKNQAAIRPDRQEETSSRSASVPDENRAKNASHENPQASQTLPLPLEAAEGEPQLKYNSLPSSDTSQDIQKKRTYKIAGHRSLLERVPH